MTSTEPTQSSHNVFQRQDHSPNGQQSQSDVRQDNPAPQRERTASPQPASLKKDTRAHALNTNSHRSQNKSSPKRKTVPVQLWVKPVVRAELKRIAEQEGLSVSATGAAFLEHALQQNLHTQHTALLDPIIEKAIGKHMRSYSTRIAVLLVRSVFASEQTRSIVTNILGRQPGVTQPVLETILNSSSNTAKRNITRVTPQLSELIQIVERWIQEGEEPHA